MSPNAAKKKCAASAFTLIELLVVIAIIALLLSVMLPSLRKAKQAAQSIVCRHNLKTLALANQVYASRFQNWYVPVVDSTAPSGERSWNANVEFRSIVGLEDAYVGSSYQMPKQYLCPSDQQANPEYWAVVGGSYQNYVSYGCNFTDWGPASKAPVSWSGNIPSSTWACRLRINDIAAPANRIMFIDAGDLWTRMEGANYKIYWDKYGQDLAKYRAAGMWYPVYYRHSEGANLAFFDGHVDHRKKEALYYYEPEESLTANRGLNESLWFCNQSNRKSAAAP